MHDEQPFCNNLTERRRTTVKILGQQSEMLIDDSWPQAGEMRSLWKGTTEFWTSDMPQDDTLEPNRHHSHILPLFRSHLTRDSAAMFPLFHNPVASNEHGCRDPHLPVVSHTENAEEEVRSVVLGLPKLTVCTVVTTMTPLMVQNLDDTGEITEANKSIQRGLTSEEKKRRSSQKKEEQSAQNKVIETAFRLEQTMEKDAPDHEIIGGEIGASRSMKTGQKKTLAGWHQERHKPRGKDGTKLSRRRRNYRVTGTRHSAVYRFL